MKKWRRLIGVVAIFTAFSVLAPAAGADPDHPDNGLTDQPDASGLSGPAENVIQANEGNLSIPAGLVSSGPFAKVTKNLAVVGRGVRNELGVTTDVWAHNGYAYTGTFSTLCSTGDNDSGVWVWNTNNVNKPVLETVINTAAGSKTNDVRVATMNSGEILVMSNESCNAGPGGFDIYDVGDPKNPVFITRVQTDDVNLLLRDELGFTDFGVHNLFLFTQGGNDYVAATVESEFGNFQIYDITNPSNPALVGFWGAEQLAFPGVDWINTTDFGGVILPADAYLFDGFGASRNRFLHDVTISADGNHAYLANWDAGLVLLDISDVTDPQVVSVAIDPVDGSIDGEVNSHSVWPNEDGSIVIEGEEDFSVFEGSVPPNITFQELATNTIPGVAASTNTGNAFEASQTGNVVTVTETAVTVDSGPLAGNVYDAVEGAGNQPKLADVGPITGNAVWVGRACNGDALANPLSAGDVAIVRRGTCFFSDKLANVAAAGASAIVVTNNQADSVWSGMRIWDYSDPTDPVLAATFDTVCAADPDASVCVPGGTYSSHNVIVETLGNKVLAYIAWYSDGMLILDISDPYNPVEVARYVGANEDDVPNDFWGVYKIPNDPFIYASDRNGGLYILQARGAGSGK